MKRAVQIITAASLTAGLLIAPTTTNAPVAEAASNQFNPCTKLNRGEVKFSGKGAKRVTFTTAARRGESRVLITNCVKTSSGKYKEEWQSWGYGGLNGFAPKGKMWENTWYSPTGSFSVTEALGRYNPGTKLKYHKVKWNSKWGGERGPRYNQYFEGPGGESDENLYTYMNQGYYEQAAVINWNRLPDMPTVQGASFAIFFHAGNTTSAGCISTHLSTVTKYLRTAAPGDRFIMGTVGDVFKKPIPKPCPARDVAAKKMVNLSRASIKSSKDVLAVGPGRGDLWNYPGNGNGDLKKRFRIDKGGWKHAVSVSIADWNNDGIYDIIAQWEGGKLRVLKGKKYGGFQSGVTVGSAGWQHMQIAVGKYCDGYAYPQVVAIDKTSGALYIYNNKSGRGLSNPVKIGSGWKSFRNLTMIDVDNNGRQDLVAKNASGYLKLYRSNGDGKFVSERRATLGSSGWKSVRDIAPVEGFDGSRSKGLVANTSSGQLRYYPLVNGKMRAYKVLDRDGWANWALGH